METKYVKCVRAVLFALAVLLSIPAAWSQNGSLRGVVTDPSGASVPEATVTLRKAPNTQLRTRTDAAGAYVFNAVPPGTYEITVARSGFAPFRAAGVNISGASTMDAQLEINVDAQQVTVNDSNNTVSTDPTQNVGAIVLKGEDLEALSDDPDQLASDLQALAGPAAGPNGGQIFIDGFSGGQMPPKANIREIRVNSNPFSAEYDRLGFGRIEIFTRPGTDKYRGQFMVMASDNVFNSRNPFVTTSGKPDFRSLFFDGNISGPLMSKKASFNLNVERRQIDENAVINATLLDNSLQPYRFNQAVITPNTRWNISPRVDYAINTNNTLVARYSYSKMDDQNNGVGNFALVSRAFNTFSTGHTVQITETAILSAKAINEFRFQLFKRENGNLGDNSVPSIVVQDAFQGGGAQVGNSLSDSSNYEISNVYSLAQGKHALKFGGRVRISDLSDLSPSNFGGTFTYAGIATAPQLDANNNPIPGVDPVRITSIEQYRRTLLFQQQGLSVAQIRALGGGASQFTISGGNPLAGVTQTDVGVFVTDDWRWRPNLTLSYGLRYENQTNISNNNNFSPRVGFAWGVGGSASKPSKTVVRGGFGIFYDRIDDSLTLNQNRFNGVNQLSYIVQNPAFLSVPSLSTLEANRIPQNVRRLSQDLRTPYIMQTAIGVERQLPKNTSVAVNYTFSRGVHMLRTLSLPVTPDASTGALVNNVYLNDSTGFLRQNQLVTNLNTRFSRRVSLFGFYMLNFARGDVDGGGTFPAVRNDFRQEWGPTSFDTRHRVFLGGSVTAPWAVTLNPFITASSGAPYNITTGIDNNGDTVFNDRPSYATDPNARGVVRTPYGLLNINPGPNEAIIPRNLGRGPSQFTVNLRMSRTWGFGERSTGSNDMDGFGGGGEGGGMRGGGGPRGGGGRGPGGGGPGGMMMGGGGGMRGGGGPGGMFGGASGKKYTITLSVSARNLLNNVNLSTPVGNLSSPLFGQSLSIAGGGFGGGPGGGGGGGAAANRRLDFTLRFSF